MQENIMIVDDDPSILFAIKELLHDEGFSVCAVSSGRTCVEQIQNGFKGLILLDLMMPDMNGWDTIAELQKKGVSLDIKFIIITAKIDIDVDKKKKYEHMIIDYIEKPFEPERLISTIKGYFNQ